MGRGAWVVVTDENRLCEFHVVACVGFLCDGGGLAVVVGFQRVGLVGG